MVFPREDYLEKNQSGTYVEAVFSMEMLACVAEASIPYAASGGCGFRDNMVASLGNRLINFSIFLSAFFS